MNTPELQVGGGLLLIIVLCYVGGRLHQWARSGIDRDQAYREGYDEATRSLFHLATRLTKDNKGNGPITKELPSQQFRAVPKVTAVKGIARPFQEPRPVPAPAPVPVPSLPTPVVAGPGSTRTQLKPHTVVVQNPPPPKRSRARHAA